MKPPTSLGATMTMHRRTPDSVSDDVHDHNPAPFNPAEALQSLHGEVLQLEALIHAASEAVTQLPFPADREERRVFDRVYALVTKAADETNALVRYSDELIAALGVYLNSRPPEGAARKSEG
jgi:hypothetical protein